MLPAAPRPNMYTLELWKMPSSFKFMLMYVWKNKKLRAYLGHVCALHLTWRERVQITSAYCILFVQTHLGIYTWRFMCACVRWRVLENGRSIVRWVFSPCFPSEWWWESSLRRPLNSSAWHTKKLLPRTQIFITNYLTVILAAFKAKNLQLLQKDDSAEFLLNSSTFTYSKPLLPLFFQSFFN